MAYDVISHFYSCLNQPLRIKIPELTRIIEQSVHNKDLNTIFLELIINIFGWPTFNGGWGLRNISAESDEYELVHRFLHPQGPMFMLCYKILGDPQITFNLPMHLLPAELRLSFETGRFAQFYADLLKYDPRVMNSPSLELNAFDYYIFYFALNLLHSTKNSTTNRYTADMLYFNLAIDYVMYFLPIDPNVAVQPHLPHFTGKMPVVATMPTVSRSLTPSLLLKPSLSDLTNQHAQSENRNEVWRSETVLQVFTDVWMSVQNVKTHNIEMYRRYPDATCAEQVRLCRVLIKQVHGYASSSIADPGARGAALRRYSRQLICTRGYRCVKYLVEVWPLDASFKVVLELWLSLLQPWRYEANSNDVNRHRMDDMDDDRCLPDAVANYAQFIAENFPTYTYILQIMLSRFLRLDLTVAKNTYMLFRLGKVFSQPRLIKILRELEKYVTANNDGYINNNNKYDNTYSMFTRWGAVAKQSIAELNMNPNFQYEPLWTEQNKPMMLEFFKRIVAAKQDAEVNCEKLTNTIAQKNKGWWSMLIGAYADDERMLNEIKDVPQYLNSSIIFFSQIFGISNTIPQDMTLDDATNSMDQTFDTSDLQNSIAQRLRNHKLVHYMGDPDLMPITSYENTILVRMFYQITSKINELYGNDFARLWNDNSFRGLVAREILQAPCTIQTYSANNTNHNSLVTQQLPARLSLRKLGTHSFVIWMTLGYLCSKLFGFTLFTFLITVFLLWIFIVLLKVTAKAIGLAKRTE